MVSVLTSEGHRVWQCTVCNFSHKKTTNVANHIESIHFEKVSCLVCGKEFGRTSRLKEHMKICQAS